MKARRRQAFLFIFPTVFFLSSSVRLPALAGHDQTEVTVLSDVGKTPDTVWKPSDKSVRTRAHLLALGTWLVSTTNYWLEGAKWTEDIDFELTFSDQLERLFSLSSYRFDSNTFTTNWQHALSGAAYYNFYRCNGFSLLASLKNSLYFSLLWEYISEYQEVVSINDMLYNTLGAVTAGENLFRFAHHFQRQNNPLQRVFGYVLNPIYALSRLLDGDQPIALCPKSPEQEHVGLLRFSLSRGDLLPLEGSQSFWTTRLEIDLFPKTTIDFSDSATLTWTPDSLGGLFSLSVSGNSDGLKEFRLKMRNTLLGWLSYGRTASNLQQALFIGLSSSMDLYRKKSVYYYDRNDAQLVWEPDRIIDHPTRYTDKLSHLGIFGPTFFWLRRSPNTQLRIEAGIIPNFAMVNSLPLNSLSQEMTIAKTKATLLYYGYYYALGYSCFVRGNFEINPLILSFCCDYQRYRSIEGLDRFQKSLSWDPILKDSFTFLEIGLHLKLFKSLQLGCVYEHKRRWGSIDRFAARQTEDRISFTTGLPF